MKKFNQFSRQINESRENLMELDRELTAAGVLAAKYGPKIVKGIQGALKLGHRVLGRPFVRANLKTKVPFSKPISQGGATPGVGITRQILRPTNRYLGYEIGKDIFKGTQKELKKDQPLKKKVQNVAGELAKGAYFAGGPLALPTALVGPSLIKRPKETIQTAKDVVKGVQVVGNELKDKFVNKVKNIKQNQKLKNIKPKLRGVAK